MSEVYFEKEHLIEDGDIVFIRTKGTFVHELITYFTKYPQIHVGIAFWVEVHGKKHLLFVDTNGGTRRRLISLSHYKDFDMDVIQAPYNWEEVVHDALDHVGELDYSWIQAAYVGISELSERTIGLTLPKLEFQSEICSKFVAELAGLEHINVSPAKLYRHLRKRGLKRKVKIRS